MELGVLLAPINNPSQQKWIAEQATRFEALGFNSLWAAQAMGRGFMMTDPLLTLATAAAVTRTIRLGTAVLQLPLYTTLELAHRIFSLQQLCGPRLVLGLGAGSTAADFRVAGKVYETRFSDFRDQHKALKTALETGQHQGSDLSPWPNLLGGPPLYLGSWGNGVEMAARNFDGWIASAHYRSTQEIIAAHTRYRGFGGNKAIVSTLQLPKGTDLGALRAQLLAFSDAGFDETAVMFLPGGPKPEAVIQLLD